MIVAINRIADRHGGLLVAMFILFGVLIAAPGFGFFSLVDLSDIWDRLALGVMQRHAIHETLVLLAGITIVASVIGVISAWLVSVHDFPGRRFFQVALILPLAFPTYLAAFVAVDVMHFFGPIQSTLRWLTGWKTARDYWFPEMRSMGGAVTLLSLVLFPYIYVPCAILFSRAGRNVIDAARLLGASGFELFWRIGLPLARPALVAGLVLALLEALNDIGAAEHLGISSLSVLIRDYWANRGDLSGAIRLALILLGLVVVLLALDQCQARHRRSEAPARAGQPRPALIPLAGWRGWLASLFCAMPVLFGFLLPVLFLLNRAVLYALAARVDASFFTAALSTFAIAAIVSLAVMIAGAIIAIAIRLLPGMGRAQLLTTLGYATPGTILALAILPVIRVGDGVMENLGLGLALTATTGVVLYALTVRFLGIGTAQAGLSLARLPKNVDHVARVHGMRDLELALRVHLPVMLPGLMLGGILVFIDTVKELPATILLRPLNFETLATRAYGFANTGQFEHASLDALMILAMSGIAAVILARRA